MKKKLIAAVTSVAMVATMVPATALAASSQAQPTAKAKTVASSQTAAAETPAQKVTRLIGAIGTVENTSASSQKIKDAEAAYNGLSDFDRAAYDKSNSDDVAKLTSSRKAYDNYAKVLAAVQAAIDKTPDKLVTKDFTDFVDKAKTAYTAFNTLKENGGSEGTVSYAAGKTNNADYKLDTARQAKYDAMQDATLKTAVEAVDLVDVSAYTDADYDNDANPAAWKTAKEAIAALTKDSLKSMIKNLSKVTAIDQAKAQDKAAIEKVNGLLSALTDAVNKDNVAAQQKAYDTAKAAFDKLSDTLQAKVSSDNTDKLNALKGALTSYNSTTEADAAATAKAAPVIEKIKKLPEDRKIELTDEAAVKAARTAYDELDSAAKAKVDAAKVSGTIAANTWLTNAESAISALVAKMQPADRAQRTMELIKVLPTPASAVTRDNTAAAEAAKTDYDAISELSTKKLVTNYDVLEAALEQIERLTAEDKAAADAVISKYPASAMNVTDNNELTAAKNAVSAAESAYNAATKWVKFEVDNAYATERGNLKTTQDNIAAFVKGLSDQEAADAILNQMKTLPSAEKITSLTLSQYQSQVRAAENAYTTAPSEVKAIVKANNDVMKHYQAAVDKVNTLEASAKVPALVEAIDNLKVLKADGTETEATINAAIAANKAARANYNALPTTQKADVTNLEKLEAAEKSEVPAEQKLIVNESKKIGITTSTLTDAQIAAINETTRLIEEYFGPVSVSSNVDNAFGSATTEKGDYNTAKTTLDKLNKDKTDAEAAPIIAAADAISSMKIDKTNADYIVKIYNDYQKLSSAAKAKVDSTDIATVPPTKANKVIETAYNTAKLLVLDLAKVEPIEDQTYTGSPIVPTIVVKNAAGTVIPSSEYNVFISSNENAGTAKVTILPNSEETTYTGTIKTTFTIKAASIEDAAVSKIADATYTGTAIKPAVKVAVSGRTLDNGTDYTVSYGSNVNKGIGTVTIKGKDNYTGTKTVKFNIKAKSISGASVSGVTDKTYTGKQIKPTTKVVVSGKTLRNGTDYTISYGKNTYLGKGTVTITAKGNYTGKISKSFKIKPAKEAITSLKAGKGKFTVKYKKQTGASYQIYYKASGVKAKTYKTSSTTKTISKLKKGKTYTVKVRAYKKIDGKTFYGSYSAAKKVKTKK